MEEFLARVIWGNTLQDYLTSFIVLFVGVVLTPLLSNYLSKLVYRLLRNYSKEEVSFDKFYELVKKPFRVFVTLWAVYWAFNHLEFHAEWNMAPVEKFGLRMILTRGFQTIIAISITTIVFRVIDFIGLVLLYRASLTETKNDDMIVPFIREALKVIVGIVSFFIILGSIYNFDVTSLVAGLGIGGLAFALAAKESLENLFGSFTIFLDKPFTIGDLIKVGSVEGVVERIGFRSTRLRTLEKTFVTVPNKKLVDTELDNITQREVRRVKYDFGVLYSTTTHQLEKIIADFKQEIKEHPHTTQDYFVHFFEFGEYSINIRVIYFIQGNDWQIYMNTREELNYKLMQIVEANGTSFAFPTTTVEIAGNNFSGQ
jgi:MscS family membrane protein